MPASWLGEDITYEPGTGPRYTLRALKDGEVIDECGGNAVSPLHEPQARRLIQLAVGAGHHVEAEAHTPDGRVEVTNHEPG